jgi:hypothetical protein
LSLRWSKKGGGVVLRLPLSEPKEKAVFSYFGCKSKLARLYPRPKHRLIVEPFAGSARYSLYHSDHEVWINDLNPRIYRIWSWLQRATQQDIERLPDLRRGQDVRRIKWLSEVERDLVGLSLCRAQVQPRNIYSGWAADTDDCSRTKQRLLKRLEDIRDWTITNLDYFDLPDIQATWFVDSPYQFARLLYPENEIDYEELAAWCWSRRGQVIVCEELGATWLPFRQLKEVWTQTRRMTEAVWTRE